MRRVHSIRAALVAAGSVSTLCHLSIAAGEEASGARASVLEEITVTADRREDSMQRVPVAVTAITADALSNQGVIRTDDLSTAVPGVQWTHEVNGSNIFIRGIGPNTLNVGNESSVAIYLDDQYLPSGQQAIFQLNSVDRLEVLKGPQGTLFGRNATGGVIVVHTKNPEMDPALDAQIGYANYDSRSANLYATGALARNLAANISVYGSEQNDGWGRNITTGHDAFTSEDYGGRAKLLWSPGDSTRVLLAVGHSFTRSQVGLSLNQVPEYAASGGTGYCPTTPPFPAGSNCGGYVGWGNTAGIRDDVGESKSTNATLRIDQELGFADLVSISGWMEMSGRIDFIQDGTAYGNAVLSIPQADRNISQEFQLLSRPDAAGPRWIVGAFFMNDNAGYRHAKLQGTQFGFPVQFVPDTFYLDLNSNVDTTSYAAYAQTSIDLTDKTRVTLGARYTDDERKFSGGLNLSPALGGTALSKTEESDQGATSKWNKLTYRLAFDHQFTDDIMGYVSLNRGFRSGNYDTFGAAATGPVITPAVDPEVVDAYEVGLKTELLDHTLRVNVAAFRSKAKNLQFSVIVPGGTKAINAAGAEVTGAELEVTALLTPAFTLSGAASVMNSEYTSFPNAPNYFIPGCAANGPILCASDASGNDMVRAPNLSANINADYVMTTAAGDVTLNGNYSYTDRFEWFADGSLPQPIVRLFNASVLWKNTAGNYDVRLWGRNLTDERYYSAGSETIGLGKQFSPASPRTYGVSVGVHF